jgi:hypothetical protein
LSIATSNVTAGLPDGIFSNQKSLFGSILEGLAIENVVHFTASMYILLPFGTFYR